jgi:hypothetical protein
MFDGKLKFWIYDFQLNWNPVLRFTVSPSFAFAEFHPFSTTLLLLNFVDRLWFILDDAVVCFVKISLAFYSLIFLTILPPVSLWKNFQLLNDFDQLLLDSDLHLFSLRVIIVFLRTPIFLWIRAAPTALFNHYVNRRNQQNTTDIVFYYPMLITITVAVWRLLHELRYSVTEESRLQSILAISVVSTK